MSQQVVQIFLKKKVVQIGFFVVNVFYTFIKFMVIESHGRKFNTYFYLYFNKKMLNLKYNLSNLDSTISIIVFFCLNPFRFVEECGFVNP